MSRLALLLALAACFALPPAARAAPPDDRLLRLVPEDVGFCLRIRDLRGHGTALANSPFVKAFPRTTLGSKLLHTQEAQKLGTVESLLQHYLHLSAEQLRNEILGDELVLAYRPGPPDQPEDEQGLLLLRARDAALLARLVERLNQLGKDSGRLKEVEEETYRGRKYYRRVEDPRVTYYYLQGPVLAAASRESLLRELIDREVQAAGAGESPLVRHFRLFDVGDPLAALWLNPRAFEPALRRKAAAVRGPQAAALKTLLTYWTALDGMAFAITLEQDIQITVAIRARVEQLPPPGRRLLGGSAAASALWDVFPPEAILTLAGQLDVPALVDFLAAFLDAEARKSFREALDHSAGAILGKDFYRPLLTALGPDWGVQIAAPPAGRKAWFPHILALLRVRPNGTDPPADRTLRNALSCLAGLAVFHHNGGRPGPLRLKFVVQDGIEVTYLVNEEAFPPGLQPAFAVKAGYLVLASSPEAIRRLRLPAPAASERGARGEGLRRGARSEERGAREEGRRPASGVASAPRASGLFPRSSLGAAVPLLRFSSRELQQFLRERRAALVAYSASNDDVSSEEAGRRFDGLLAALQLLDGVELSRRSAPDPIRFTLRIQLAQPLK